MFGALRLTRALSTNNVCRAALSARNGVRMTSFRGFSSSLTMMNQRPEIKHENQIDPEVNLEKHSFSVDQKPEAKEAAATEAAQEEAPLPDLTILKMFPDLYAQIRIHGKTYLVTEGDVVTLDYNMKGVELGDVLNFTDVITIGCRDYTYSNDPIDPRLFSIKGCVIEKTKAPMIVKYVKKPRHRRGRHHISKPDKVLLRISELKLL